MLNKLLGIKGQIVTLKWHKDCKTKKSVLEHIEKNTTAKCIRIGCGYDNLSAVKEGRENGTLPEENAGLAPSLEWEVYPTIIRNKNTGKRYVRVELMPNSKFESEFFMDGASVNKADIEEKLLASEKSRGSMPTVMNIPLENITEVVCG